MDLRRYRTLTFALSCAFWCLHAPFVTAEQSPVAEQPSDIESPVARTDEPLRLVTDTANHPMTPVARPAPGQSLIDPEFGTRIVRITDARRGGVIRPMYSTIPAWNCDESLLLLWDRDTGHVLYDGHTYGFIKVLDIDPTDLEHVIWDTTDPSIIRFPAVELIGGTPATEDAVVAIPGPSGERFYLDGVVYDFEMNRVLGLGLRIPEHASIGRLPNGHDAYFSVQYDTEPNGTLVAFDMTTGKVSVLVGPANGYPYPPAGTHISAVAYRNPSMIAVSIIGFQADGQSLLDNELLLANTVTGEVARVAHHHSLGRNGDFGYWAEPHVVISPTGTRLLFGSDWGGDSVDTYVAELPGYGE
jgi:hypothetical protein